MNIKTISINQRTPPKIHSARELHDYSKEKVQHYLSSVIRQEDPGLKYMDMFMLLQNLGLDEFSLEIQQRALRHRTCFRLLNPPNAKLRLLALYGPGNMQQNGPLDFLLFDTDISLDVMYLSEKDLQGSTLEVPDHDVAIIAMSASSTINPILKALVPFTNQWPRPVLNNTQGILQCERDKLHALLAGISGLTIPPMKRLARDQIQKIAPGFLIRPVDTHGGNGFFHMPSHHALSEYLNTYVADSYFVTEFVDYRDSLGFFRKNRIAFIDLKPYICHRATADHWMISYKNAHMELSQSKRDDEQSFMENFDSDFVARHAHSLREMAYRINLDYVVVDCAETQTGELLIFEADNAAWIHDTDPVSIFPYKHAVMSHAFSAFREMLLKSIQ